MLQSEIPIWPASFLLSKSSTINNKVPCPPLIEAKVVSTETSKESGDIDPLESVLNLEEWYYKQGYEEGFADGLKSGPEEGFEFGHQVSFQKFLPVGILLGRCATWKRGLVRDWYSVSEAKKARALRHIETLESMILGLETRNETESEHGKFDEMKRKLMAKSRVVESLIGEDSHRDLPGNVLDEDTVALAKRMDRELQL